MLKRLLSTIVVLILIHLTGFGQFQDKIPAVAPIPPDAAAMFKILERPLGTYTGTIPISFPLVQFTSGPLSADVQLNYNSTGGIRVEEIASSVGLGFSLTDGAGRITQSIRGLRDDIGWGMLVASRKPSDLNCSDMESVWLTTMPNQWDLEPDIFMYELNGKTGKFCFLENGAISLAENDGIKIEYEMESTPTNGIKRWIITDEKGNKYYFGQNKAGTTTARTTSTYTYESISNPSNTRPGQASRSWYLTEAYDMNEENTLKYTYVNTSGQTIAFAGGFRRFYPINSNCNNFNMISDQAVVKTIMSEMLVSRIDGRDGYVLFNSAADRLDGTFGRKINNVEVYDSSGMLKKRFKFNYGYFNAGSGDPMTRRLKLVSFSEFGTNTTDSLSYAFQYEELQNLPNRLSNAVDFWGFFNNSFNSSMFPNLVYKYVGTTIRETRAANRNAVPGYAEANILKKITYPTGGYRQFVYEGNTALVNSSNQHWVDPDFTANQAFTRTDFNNFVLTPQAALKHNFTVNSTDGGTTFTYNLSTTSGTDYTIKLFVTTTPTDQFGGYQLYSWNGISSMYLDLINGYYRIEVYRNSIGTTLSSLDGSWGESTLNLATITTPNGIYNRDNRQVGGVRIKEIRDYDPLTATTHVTEYRYKLYSTDSTFTSGLLVSPVTLVSYENPSSQGCNFLAVHTSSCYPLATQGSAYVVYPEVRTVENGNGWTDRIYNYSAEYIPAGYPLVPPPDQSNIRGWLMSERVYNQAGVLQRKSMFGYTTSYSPSQLGMRVKPYYNDIMDNGGEDREFPRNQNEWPYRADCNSYYTGFGTYVPFSRTDSTFTPAGNYMFRIDYSYYNYNNHLLLKTQKQYVNDNSTRETTFKYPFNTNGEFTFGLTAAEQTMKSTLLSKNFLQQLEAVDSLKPSAGAGSLLGGQKYSYANYYTDNIHLAQGRNYNSPTGYSEINLSAYDVLGNVTQKNKTGDVNEVYLWGYDKNYVVARVIGSTASAVAGMVVDATIQSLTITDAAMRTELNKIRTGLAGTSAQVYTYTYDPLVGMTSETDPAGRTTYYEYDSLGRLKLIKDRDGKITKQFDYQYNKPVTQ